MFQPGWHLYLCRQEQPGQLQREALPQDCAVALVKGITQWAEVRCNMRSSMQHQPAAGLMPADPM